MKPGYSQDVGRPRVAEGLGQLRRHCASASEQQGLGHGVVRLRDGLFEAPGEAVTNGEYFLHQTVSLALSHQLHTGADHRGEYALPCQVVPVVEVFENGRLLRLASHDKPVAVAKMLLVPGRRQRGRDLGYNQQVAVGCVPALANPHMPDGQREARQAVPVGCGSDEITPSTRMLSLPLKNCMCGDAPVSVGQTALNIPKDRTAKARAGSRVRPRLRRRNARKADAVRKRTALSQYAPGRVARCSPAIHDTAMTIRSISTRP